MKSRRGRFLLGAGLAVLLLAAVFYGVEWQAVAQAMSEARPLPLCAVVVVTLSTYWLRAWRWGALLAPVARVGPKDLFSATMVGFAASLVIPRSGELLRPWLVSRRHPVPLSAGFATIVIERLIDLITVLVLFALYLFVLPRPEAQAHSRLMEAVTLGGAGAAAVGFGVLCFLLALHANADRVVRSIDRLFARAPRWIADPVGRALRSFSAGLAVLRAPLPHLAFIALQSLLLWLVTALGFHLVQVAFAIELPFQTTFLLIAFLVVGEAIPTPGLVGGFHAFYVLALVEVYGVDRTTAVAAAVAAHALTNLPVLAVGAALLSREGLSLRRLGSAARAEDSHGA